MESGGTSNPQAESANIFNINIQEKQINNTHVNDSWKNRHNTKFDIDSKTIGIDNRCSACISHDIKDFIPNSIKRTNKQRVGFGGVKHNNIEEGTIKWDIMDDNGQAETFIIRKSYHVPKGGVRLLSPQHWAREYKHFTGKGAYELTNEKEIKLIWNNGENVRTTSVSYTHLTLPTIYSV